MNVICFGDSNTYGYDPRSYFGGRYDADSRWVDILAAQTGWTISNIGQNGREIPSVAPTFPADTDLLIVMLGINDLLQGRSPEQAAERLESFLSGISLDRKKILLIAPPPVALGAWVPNQQLIDDSHTFAKCCQTLAERMGIRFADDNFLLTVLCLSGYSARRTVLCVAKEGGGTHERLHESTAPAVLPGAGLHRDPR